MPGGSNCYQLDCADTRTLFFSVKVPQIITHETALVDCEAELVEFLKTMGLFGNELGPIVFQFPFLQQVYFQRPSRIPRPARSISEETTAWLQVRH